MSDKTETGETLATDLAPAQEKRRDMSSGLPRIDVNDPDQVFELALELVDADKRRLMQVTLVEWQAVDRLAVMAAPVLTHALGIAEKFKPGESWDALAPQLLALVKVTVAIRDAAKGAARGQEKD